MDGRAPFCTTVQKPMVEAIVCWYFEGNHETPGFLNGGAKWISYIHSMCTSMGQQVGPFLIPLKEIGSIEVDPSRAGTCPLVAQVSKRPNIQRLSRLVSTGSARSAFCQDARAAQLEYEQASLACRARRVEEEDAWDFVGHVLSVFCSRKLGHRLKMGENPSGFVSV